MLSRERPEASQGFCGKKGGTSGRHFNTRYSQGCEALSDPDLLSSNPPLHFTPPLFLRFLFPWLTLAAVFIPLMKLMQNVCHPVPSSALGAKVFSIKKLTSQIEFTHDETNRFACAYQRRDAVASFRQDAVPPLNVMRLSSD